MTHPRKSDKGIGVDRVVRLSPYDWRGSGPAPDSGHYIKSSRSAYFILGVKANKRRTGRYTVEALRLHGGHARIPDEAIVHDLHWYPRRRTRLRAL